MKLIDVVKDSLDANGIAYTIRLVAMPSNMLIAHTVIKGENIDCMVSVNERGGIITVEYGYGQLIDESMADDIVTFIMAFNQIASLGQLVMDNDLNVTFKDGLFVDYVANPKQSIAAFIRETGNIAMTAFPYLQSIISGTGTVEGELSLLIEKSNNLLQGLGLNN